MGTPWASGSSASLGGDGDTLTLVDESTFCISDRSGDVVPDHPHGLFVRDTRFVSELRLRVNGRRPEPLAASNTDPFSGTFVSRDHPVDGRADSPLLVLRHRYVGQGMREDLVIRNSGEKPATCTLELAIGCDFADLFEVKAGRVERIGGLARRHEPDCLVFGYEHGEFRRSTRVQLSAPAKIEGDVAVFDIEVPTRGEWSVCVQFTPVLDDVVLRPRHRCGRPVERVAPPLGGSRNGSDDARPSPSGTSPSDDSSRVPRRTSPHSGSSTRSTRSVRSSPRAHPGS